MATSLIDTNNVGIAQEVHLLRAARIIKTPRKHVHTFAPAERPATRLSEAL
jgi:hypothetical protein